MRLLDLLRKFQTSGCGNPITVARSWLLGVFLASLCSGVIASTVCIRSSIVGMERIVEEIHSLLGEDTRDIGKLKLYVADYKGRQYIQSNYLAPTVKNRGLRHIHPTKLLLDAGDKFSLEDLLFNVLFPETQRSPTEQELEAIQAAMKSVVVHMEASTLAHDGRPASGLNLAEVSNVSVVHNYQPIGSGKFAVLKLSSPPPSIVEFIKDGLWGRPPGRGLAIHQRLKSQSLGSSSLVFESMILNSATDDVIQASPELSAARRRSGTSTTENWEQRMERALDASSGKSLLLLSHISEGKVVVEDLSGQTIFQIDIAELSQRAASKNVELILIGCDTASYIEDNSLPFGVVGRHDSQAMAQRLASILPRASNLGELAEQLSGPDLRLVVYDKKGGYGYEGASGFARLANKDQWVRVFRILSLKFTGRS